MSGWTCYCGATDLQGTACLYCGRRAWWLPVDEDPAPPKAPLDPLGRAIAVAVCLLLAAGLVSLNWKYDALRRAEFAAAVAELSDYVATVKGRPFLRPVRADLMSDAEFDAVLYADPEEYDEESDEPGDFAATMLALRLADADEGADEVSQGAGGSDIVGFYDDLAERLYVRGKRVTAYTRLVLVHELTHAWQDQHHDLGALKDRAADGDHSYAISALIEGDATRIEEQWRGEQSAADQAAIEKAEETGDAGALTRTQVSLGLLSGFPYAAGAEFVRAVAADGGEAAVARAFANPPTTTEQVLHPEAYARAERPARVLTPGADGAIIDEGVLGELGLVLVLARGDLDSDAVAAARGWAGDKYVTWEDDDQVCTRALVRMDSTPARDRLVRTLRERATGLDQQVTRHGRTAAVLRYCVLL